MILVGRNKLISLSDQLLIRVIRLHCTFRAGRNIDAPRIGICGSFKAVFKLLGKALIL